MGYADYSAQEQTLYFDTGTRSTNTLRLVVPDITARSSSFKITPTMKFAYSTSADSRNCMIINDGNKIPVTFAYGGSTSTKQTPSISDSRIVCAPNTLTDYQYQISAWTVLTSTLFTSNNPTTRTINITAQLGSGTAVATGYLASGQYTPYARGKAVLPTGPLTVATVTLDVPPTATVSSMYYDVGYVYAGLTTASVDVSNVAAYYGGSVTDVTLTIGTQTDSISGNGTCSILLDTAGTFTPTVTVTDSRGQTKVYTLDPITVNTYAPPTVNFTAERTTSAGVPDDEGTYATLDATFVFADVIATAIAPSVVMTDENGTQTTPTVTWYSSRAADGTLSGSVTWSSLSSGDTVYGLVPGLNTNYSYQISVRPRDSQGTGTAILQTVASAFYTIDFLAGGHGIAFGQPASTTGFVCNMTATFNDDADFGDDVFIELPDYQTSSTTDKALYDAIVALGWDSDVLIP